MRRLVNRSKLNIAEWFRKRNGAKQQCLIGWKCTKGHTAGFKLIGASVETDEFENQLAWSICPHVTFSDAQHNTIVHIELIPSAELTQGDIDEYSSLKIPIAVVDPKKVSGTFEKIFAYRVFNMIERYNVPDKTCYRCNPPNREWIPPPSARRTRTRFNAGSGFQKKRR